MLFTQRRRLQEKYRRVRFGNISYLELEKVSKQIILITKISRLNLNDIYYFLCPIPVFHKFCLFILKEWVQKQGTRNRKHRIMVGNHFFLFCTH